MQQCEADQEQKHQKRAAIGDTYRAANLLRMAAMQESSWVDRNFEGPPGFCLGTGVPRHSAGGVGTFVRTYVRGKYVRTWYVSFAMRMRE